MMMKIPPIGGIIINQNNYTVNLLEHLIIGTIGDNNYIEEWGLLILWHRNNNSECLNLCFSLLRSELAACR